MISMLRAIRLDRAMSPIDVIKANGQGYTHTLYHGCHRLAASIAVGYPLVPKPRSALERLAFIFGLRESRRGGSRHGGTRHGGTRHGGTHHCDGNDGDGNRENHGPRRSGRR